MSWKRFFKLSITAFILLVVSIILTYSSSYYISKHFGNPPIVQDFLWLHLPNYNIIWLSEILMIIIAVWFIYSVWTKNKYLIPYAIILVSIFHILRAGLILLTPLGFPQEYNGFLGADSMVFRYGAFPSGHLSVPYLIFMITGSITPLIATILVGLTLLISRGHYTIDLIGTLLLAYPLYKFSEKYLRKYFENV